MHHLFLLAIAVSVMATIPARAQSTEMVDVDLIRAYMYMFELRYAHVVPGTVRGGVDLALVRPGLRTLGTLAVDYGTDIENEAVFAHSDRPAQALLDMLYSTPPNGWTFIESGPHWMGDGLYIAFCSEDGAQKARYSIVPDPEGGTFVVFGIDGSCLPEDVTSDGPPGTVGVIGDGEIIDEPDERPTSPGLPTLRPGSDVIQLHDRFDVDGVPRFGGTATRVSFPGSTVPQAADQAAAVFEVDGWSHLGTHAADEATVSLWTRIDNEGQRVVATVTVRPTADGADVSASATR